MLNYQRVPILAGNPSKKIGGELRVFEAETHLPWYGVAQWSDSLSSSDLNVDTITHRIHVWHIC